MITYLRLEPSGPVITDQYLKEQKWPPASGLVPWGIRESDQKLIYAPKETPPPKAGSYYSFYDANNNYRPRVRFEAALAAFVLNDFSCVMPAIRAINTKMVAYLTPKLQTDAQKEALGKKAKGVLYTSWYGRIGLFQDRPADVKEIADKVLDVLQNPGRYSLQQIINVYGMFVSQNVCTHNLLGFEKNSSEYANWKHWEGQLKQVNVTKERAREKREEPDTSQKEDVGYIPVGDTQIAKTERRPRAVDEFKRKSDFKDATAASGSPLPFVAAISGSTAELVRIAKVFGPLDSELFKQFLLGCAAFLVGGGHHSVHEVMQVAREAGADYTDGQYDAMLPDSFKLTAWYELLVADFADILFIEYHPELDRFA